LLGLQCLDCSQDRRKICQNQHCLKFVQDRHTSYRTLYKLKQMIAYNAIHCVIQRQFSLKNTAMCQLKEIIKSLLHYDVLGNRDNRVSRTTPCVSCNSLWWRYLVYVVKEITFSKTLPCARLERQYSLKDTGL